MKKPNTIEYKKLIPLLPKRTPHAHKGNFGHVLVVGGDYGYAGAPLLAALGALSVGAGLVTLASHKDNLIGLNSCHPEIMTCAIDQPSALAMILSTASVMVIGPGLGRSDWSKQIFLDCIQMQLPIVLDADGLYWLSQLPQQRTNWVLTPHPGEAARLLNKSESIAIDQRIDAIQAIINNYNATVVLKGHNTLVGSPNQTLQVCTAGNPGMASGGMGDLLSGVIAGLLAQHLETDSAAKLGVAVHALAGDIAAKQQGQRGLIASDLLPQIRKLVN